MTAGLATEATREETMAREFKLPDIGEGVHEGEVVKWFVKEGDAVKENDPVVEVMTDKVTVQIPSPVTGKILQLRAKEGEVVKVGSTLVVFGEAGEAVPTRPEAARPTAPPPAPARTEAPPAPSPTGDILAAPAVRRLAKELNVNLAAIRGSGPQGRLSEDDVRKAAHGPARTTVVAPPPAVAVAPGGSEQRIPIHGLRKRIFEKMARSNVTAAHFTYVEEVDMTQLVHLRDHLKPTADRKGVKLTFLPFFVKAILAALVEFPTLNASVDDERGEIVVKRYYNIGIATATDEGLTVTVVHDADKKGLWDLAKEIERLAAAARDKKLSLQDVQGSTFTITSLGKEGGIFATPIINWPEVAILGIHKIEKRPVVIGAGPGGYPAAIRAAQLGKRVLLVERDRLGGECLNYGCIPSKALIHTGNLIHAIERAGERGLETGPVKLDLAKLQQWKTSVVQRLVNGVGQLCKGNRVDVLSGHASFMGPNDLEIRKADGSDWVTFTDAIIATGGRPSDLPAFRFDGKRVISTKEALELPRVPQNFAIIGGGVSGLEIGMFYAKLGSRVVVIEIMEQLLPGTDPEAVRVVARNLQKLGVEVHIKSQARGWREDKGQTVVDIVTPEGLIARRADIILVTVGRKPNTDELHAEVAGVEFGPRGYVKVDRQLRTSNPHVYAIGDVIGPPFLAHKATKERGTAAEVIAGHPVERDAHAMPAAIFTDPEIATVGLQEAEANAQGRRTRMGRVPFAAIGRALTTGEYDGFVKLIADADTKVLLGATIVGPNASDLISELTLAIEMGATLADIALTVHPHPTLPEAGWGCTVRAMSA